jgi:hypothetical protein
MASRPVTIIVGFRPLPENTIGGVLNGFSRPPLFLCPSHNAWANSVNDSGNFMSRDPRVLNAGPQSILGHDITVTDATSIDLYSHMAGTGLWDLAFNKLKGAAGTSDLYCTHL